MNRRKFLHAGALATLAPATTRAASTAPSGPTSPPWTDARLRRLGAWDAHCHVSTPGATPAARMERLVAIADRVGVERLCVFMSPPWQNDPTPEQFRRSNDDVLAILKEWSARAFGFVYLNPNYPRESLDELNRCVADGPMIGIKLWVACRCNRPALDPIVARAAELDAVIFQHTWLKQRGTGNLPGESTPMELAELATRHPSAPLICGHAGGDRELGLRAIRPHSRVYADLGGGDPVSGEVELAVRELGAARVLYGSDAGGRSFASQLGRVLGADISDADKNLILRDNLRGLLRPALRRKGIEV